MTAQHNIRLATADDASAIQAIYAPYVEGTAITFELEAPSVAEMARRITTTLENYPWLVIETDEGIVGYAYAGAFRPRAAYKRSVELSIYIAQDKRGGGLGRALYAQLEEILRKQGIQNMYACITSTARPDDPYLSPGSVHFHEKLGFAYVGTFRNCGFKFGNWYSMLWMGKDIGEHEADPAPFVPVSQLT